MVCLLNADLANRKVLVGGSSHGFSWRKLNRPVEYEKRMISTVCVDLSKILFSFLLLVVKSLKLGP